MRRKHGFTLVELLVGMAVLGVVLLAVVQFAAGSWRNYRAAVRLIERSQIESTARDVVVQELGLAGYGLGLHGELPGATVEIGIGSGADRSDAFTVHYLEERWLAEPQRRSITIDVMRDSGGHSNLYRREETATRQPAVQEVTNLKLVALYDDRGQQVLAHEPWPAMVSGLMLQISFSWDSERLAFVSFGMPQPVARLPR